MTWFFQQGHSRMIKQSSVARSRPSMQNKGKQRPVMGNRRETTAGPGEKKPIPWNLSGMAGLAFNKWIREDSISAKSSN